MSTAATSDDNNDNKREVTIFHFAICPECDKSLDVTVIINEKNQDQPHEQRQKQAAKAAATQHNKDQGHNASHVELRLVEPSKAERKAQEEMIQEERFKLLKEIFSLYR